MNDHLDWIVLWERQAEEANRERGLFICCNFNEEKNDGADDEDTESDGAVRIR